LLVNTPNIAFGGYRVYARLSGGRPFGDGHHVRFWDCRFLRTNLLALARLREARRGWLDEHLMLRALTDEAGPRGVSAG
jgi:hypothetical protein